MGCHRLVLTFAILIVVVALTTPSTLAAGGRARRGGELGFQFGVLLPDRDLSGRPATPSNVEPTFGIRGDYEFSPRWGWFVDSNVSVFESVLNTDITTYSIRTGAELFTRPHWTDYQTFFAFGGGWLAVDRDQASDFTRTFASLSGGQRFTIGPNQLIRWELRVDHTVTDDGLQGADLTTGLLLLGYTWGIPNRARDIDADGVPDRKDDCPATPQGARVDVHGCSLDGDGDGVPDGIDRCPDTPAGWPVDSTGCPLDRDDDGVADGVDRCPDTPVGAIVDPAGCPLDGDDDGVPDGIDECPDTPPFAHVNARGCPLDSDGDGVFDGIDRCPQTPTNADVDEFGCPVAEPLFEARTQLVLEGVGFGLNSDRLTPESRVLLDGVAASLLAWPEVRVEVGGHTDTTGAAGYNLELSRKRADAVRAYLIFKGVPPGQLTARGYGEADPIADNSTQSGRARNRRVELKRLD